MQIQINRTTRSAKFILILTLLILATNQTGDGLSSWGGDFLTYWVSAKYIRDYHPTLFYKEDTERIANYYAVNLAHNLNPREWASIKGADYFFFTQTPFLYSSIGLITTDNIVTDGKIFQAISVISLLIAIFIFTKISHHSIEDSLILAILILYSFYPIISDINNTNVNRILLGLLALSLVCITNKSMAMHFLGGTLAGIAVMMKPICFFAPTSLCVLKIRRKQWAVLLHTIIGLLLGVILAMGITYKFFHSFGCWSEWLQKVGTYPLANSSLQNGNYSLASLLFASTGKDWSLTILFLGGSFVITRFGSMISLLEKVSPLGRSGADPTNYEEYHFFAIGCLIWLLCFPLVWEHYYTLTLPIIIYILSPSWQLNNGTVKRILSWVIVANSCLSFGNRLSSITVGWFYWTGTLILFILGTGPIGSTSIKSQSFNALEFKD